MGQRDRTQLSGGGGGEDKRPFRSHHRVPTVTINVGQYFNRIRLSLTESSGRARKATSRWRGQRRRWTGEVGADAPRPKRSRMLVQDRHLVWQHRRMSCDCHRHSHTSRSGLGCEGIKNLTLVVLVHGCSPILIRSQKLPLFGSTVGKENNSLIYSQRAS